MKLNRFLAVLAAVLLVGAFSVNAQVVNANLTGTVTMDNNPLPGVTVTITSPNMQGSRSTTSDVNGNYNFAGIPAGTYKVTFEMQGMQNVNRNVSVGVGQTGRADADMKLTAVAEAITVTASAPAVLETTEVSTNLQQQTINKLPTSRTVTGVALLAPGTTSTGPRAALVISGATADQNLITVDGAVIQENLRGQTHGLFIEDAIQETTILTGAISAEYGRFTGGVVNSITKSGGNEFHGSYRDNIDKPKWTQVTPFPGDVRGGNITNQVHEATLGGRIIRDRLWFFAAGRKTKSSTPRSFTNVTPGSVLQTFNVADDAKRSEGKLTGQITPKHSVVATYLNSPLKEVNNCQLGCVEQAGIDPSIQQGNNFYTGHYNGILTNNLLIEALYSRKTFAFIGFGGDNTDPVAGSPLLMWNSAFTSITDANAPYFCGTCGNETRNNNAWNLKTTYFWSTKSAGTHNIVGGYERWSESRFSNNYQSPTNFVLNTYDRNFQRDASTGQAFFGLESGGDWLVYYPILTPSLGSDLRTKSLFVNDKWDLNTHWNINLGARYDRNDAVNSLHQSVSKDSNVSPRLGVNYDVLGNGKYRLTAAYNTYVGRLAEGVTSASSPAGSPASFYYLYEGPTLSHLTSSQYSAAFFSWLNSVGGINKLTPFFTSVPGAQTLIRGSLKSPNVKEYTVGGGMQIGNGFVRADIIKRDWKDFYVNVRNATTGTVLVNGAPADLTLISNSNDPKRTYRAIELQGQYRLFSSLQLGGNYTFSRLRGNAVQENAGSGPIAEGFSTTFYPEFANFAQNAPVGYLPSDQTHKVRAWASYDLHTFVGNLNLSAIQRYDSGQPYSATGSVRTSWENVTKAPAYVSPPTTETYFFSKRGEFRTNALRATDLAATFSFPSFHGAELYIEGYGFNIFNNHAIFNTTSGASSVINTTILTGTSANCGTKFGRTIAGQVNTKFVTCQPFNPFTDKPVEFIPGVSPVSGTYNFQRQYDVNGNTIFGTPTSKAAYQNPRSYSMAVGVRF